MRQSVRGYVDATVERCAREGQLSQIAADMEAVSAVIAASDDLRTVIAESAIAVSARRTVLDELLSAKVDEATWSLVSFVVDTERASEIPADIAWIATHLRAASERLEAVPGQPLGFKAAEERVLGYASAVLESVGGEAELGEVEDELFRYRRIVGASADLGKALSDTELPARSRRDIVGALLDSKVTLATAALAAYPVTVGRPRDYEGLLDVLLTRVADEANRRVADVRSAVELDESQRSNLSSALSRTLRRNVDIRVEVDPSLIGGFVATVGDVVVDGSVRRQLDILKERLVAPELNTTTGERL